jgi:Tfp pilus assembly protein PilF
MPCPTNTRRATARKHYGEAFHFFYRNDYSGAVDLLSDAINLDPDNPLFFYYRGLAYRRTGHLDKAERDLRLGSEGERTRRSEGIGLALARIQGKSGCG